MAKVDSLHIRLDADTIELLDAEVRARRVQVAKAANLPARDVERVVHRSAVLADCVRRTLKPEAA